MAVKKMGKAITFFDISGAYFGWHIEGRYGEFLPEKHKFSEWTEISPQFKALSADVEVLGELTRQINIATGHAFFVESDLKSNLPISGKDREFIEEYYKCKEERKKKEKEYYDKYHGVITEFFDKLRQDSLNKPILLSKNGSDLIYAYHKDSIYKFDRTGYSDEEMFLQIMNLEDSERRKFERLKHQFSEAEKIEKEGHRPAIPEEVRIAVWRRDEGKCVKCGSRENLEYDHIVPISKGGSNTVRNIELLCQKCNREKKDNIC